MVSCSKSVVGILLAPGVTAVGLALLTDPSQPGAQSLAPGSVLLRDDFNGGAANGWTASPLGNAVGWSIVGGAFSYDGRGHTQSYLGDPSWSDYTLDVKIRLATLGNYPGGVRGRVDPATGAGYAVWLSPGTGEIWLARATALDIASPGFTQLGIATRISFDTGAFHALRVIFTGSVIEVFYDGRLVILVTDMAYRSGVIALDVSNQPIDFDDVTVTTYNDMKLLPSLSTPVCLPT